jgi:hypothetical protein
VNEHLQMVEDCEAREGRLTKWQRDFIDSIGHVLARGGSLTPKQAETLESIWEQATRKG